MDENDTRKIEVEFEKQIQELRESIDRVGLRQDELRGYVFEVTDIVKEIQSQISSLPSNAYEAKGKFHLAMQKNNELISRLYDTIANFESVRHRYQQDIGRLTKDKIYFINIELRKVEEKMDSNSSSMIKFMKELRSLVSSVTENPEVSSKILGSIEKKT